MNCGETLALATTVAWVTAPAGLRRQLSLLAGAGLGEEPDLEDQDDGEEQRREPAARPLRISWYRAAQGMPGPAQRAGAAASGAREDAAAAATMERRGTAESAGRHSVLQIFPPTVEFRNVEIGKTYTATLKASDERMMKPGITAQSQRATPSVCLAQFRQAIGEVGLESTLRS